MTPKLLIGTHNPGKVREYRVLLDGLPFEIVGFNDISTAILEVEETGDTFADNAELKARAYAQASGLYALADDSGLCVDALDGRPGLYSARYGEPGLDDAGRRRVLLNEMRAVLEGQRAARFVCVIAVANPQTLDCITVEGECRGRIALVESDGPEGFGYDALFVPDGYDKTFAQFTRDEKNCISHRGRAAQALLPLLRNLT